MTIIIGSCITTDTDGTMLPQWYFDYADVGGNSWHPKHVCPMVYMYSYA